MAGVGRGAVQVPEEPGPIFFSAVNFFLQFLVIKTLDPAWIRIRIGIQPRCWIRIRIKSIPYGSETLILMYFFPGVGRGAVQVPEEPGPARGGEEQEGGHCRHHRHGPRATRPFRGGRQVWIRYIYKVF